MNYIAYNNTEVFYRTLGTGSPLIIIHGNSVSSRMHIEFEQQLAGHFTIISPDLPGHGDSGRIDPWPADFWYENAKVIAALCTELKLKKTTLLGYSGGALIALNAALEHPGIVSAVIADSFEGERSVASYAENIFEARDKDKRNTSARAFWEMMHGPDWEAVVDADSSVINEHHKHIRRFFHKPLSGLQAPALLTGTSGDEYIPDIKTRYQPLCSQIPECDIKIYNSGGHPACLTVGSRYLADIVKFIKCTLKKESECSVK